MREPESYPFPSLRARIAHLAAEGREPEREATAWLHAELQIRGPVGFNPHRQAPSGRPSRLRYPIIEPS
jgi:hypothetical protein